MRFFAELIAGLAGLFTPARLRVTKQFPEDSLRA